MRRSYFFTLLFALSLALFFGLQTVFSSTWFGLAESAPLALISVLLTVGIDRRHSRVEYQESKLMLSRRLASSFLFVAGFTGVEIAIFYIVLTLPGGAAASGYPGSSFWSVYDAATSATIQHHILHLGSHFAFSSALAAGYGIALMALAIGPVWHGEAWGWKTTLITGLIPSVGMLLALLYYPLDHPYFAIFPLFWLLGTILALKGCAR